MPSSSMPVNDGNWNMFNPCETRPSAARPTSIGASPPRLVANWRSNARRSELYSGQVRAGRALATDDLLRSLEHGWQASRGQAAMRAGVRGLFPTVHAAQVAPY